MKRLMTFPLTCAYVAIFYAVFGVARAAEPPQPVRAGGLEIFYGVIPAEILLGHSASHEERKMHGGIPRGRGQHHIIVSIFDGKTQKRVENAAITAKVGELGLGIQEKKLDPMQFAGTVTYGNYFRMSSSGPYRIELEIRIGAAAIPVKSTFEYSHPRR